MRTTAFVGIVLVAAAIGVGAQDPLRAAKDQYAAAAYEDALATLNRMDTEGTAPEVARQIEQYRAFCLFALGRTKEAETVAESMVRKDPLARLDSVDASPRLELMFTDVRKRLLPLLIRERFKTARGALDVKSFDTAKPLLTDARQMIGEAEKLGVKDDGLGDMNALIDGFLQLIRFESEKVIAPPPVVSPPVVAEAAVVPPPAATVPPVTTPPAGRVGAPPASTPSAGRNAVPSTGAAATTVGPRVYTIEDKGVIPPVALDQKLPALSPALAVVIKGLNSNGLFDILIDERGRVLDATVRKPLHSSFDTLVTQSARSWRYQPATKDGVPVRYLKTLLLVP